MLKNIAVVRKDGCYTGTHAFGIVNQSDLADFNALDVGDSVMGAGRQDAERDTPFTGSFSLKMFSHDACPFPRIGLKPIKRHSN